MAFWSILLNGILRRRREESEMTEELRFHLESRAEHLERLGMATAEAKRQAQLEFGGVESYKERCREARGFHMFDEVGSDVRYGLRTLVNTPGFTLMVVLSLALSIGVNLSCFASLYSMVLHPFAFQDLDRIMTVSGVNAKSVDRNLVAGADYLDWRKRSRSFEKLAAYRDWDANLSRVDHPDHLHAAVATAEFFSVLGIRPELGRAFTADECQPGSDAVAVVSHGFWQARLASVPNVLGQTIALNGRRYTIIGVMPDEFNLPLAAEVWAPLALTPQDSTDRERQQFSVLGKLRSGVTERQASAEMDRIARQLELQYPQTNESRGIAITSLMDTMTSENSHFLSVLMCAALFVLLLGSINVGGLQVARAMSRQKEVALRGALGASGWRIFRQLLTENLMLALAGGIFGLALAVWHLNLIRANIPPAIYLVAAGLRNMRIDGHVALYGIVLSVVAGVLCSLPAAFEATRLSRSGDLNEALKEGGRSSRSSALRRPLRTLLVVGEVALAFVLLAGAGVMVTTLRKIATLNLGYDTGNLLTARVSLSEGEYRTPSRVAAFYEDVLRNMSRSQDTDATAVVGDSGPAISVFIEGREKARPGELRPTMHAASSQYLRAMRLPLVGGRWLAEQDNSSAHGVVVLSTSVVRHYWPNSNPIGQRVRLGSADSPWLTVVGVAGDTNDWFLGRPEPAAYVSYLQYPQTAMQFLVRGRIDSRKLAGRLRAAARALDKEQPIYDVHTMADEMHEETTGVRNAADMMGTYAAIALLLAVTGIYSITSFFVMQRKPDIAVRISLGATRKSILRMVLRHSFRLTAWGLAVGVPLAVLLTLGMSRALYGIVPVEPTTFLVFTLVLSGSAALAGYVPAYRATRVDPITILRQQ